RTQQVVQLVQTVVDRFDGELDPLRQPPGFPLREDHDRVHAAPLIASMSRALYRRCPLGSTIAETSPRNAMRCSVLVVMWSLRAASPGVRRLSSMSESS